MSSSLDTSIVALEREVTRLRDLLYQAEKKLEHAKTHKLLVEVQKTLLESKTGSSAYLVEGPLLDCAKQHAKELIKAGLLLVDERLRYRWEIIVKENEYTWHKRRAEQCHHKETGVFYLDQNNRWVTIDDFVTGMWANGFTLRTKL